LPLQSGNYLLTLKGQEAELVE